MDFDKLAEAWNDKELPKLFTKRNELRVKIGELDTQRAEIVAEMASVEAKITEAVGATPQPAETGKREAQKCSDCEELGIDNGGHHSRKGPKHDKWIADNRERLLAEGKLKEAA